MAKIGRPKGTLVYDPKDFQPEIIEWVSAGKTLQSYSRQKGKPSVSLIQVWRDNDPAFAANFARARDLGYDAIAAEVMEIADTPSDHPDDVQHRKLRTWTRLQLLAKWDPRRYGDRAKLEHSGGISLKVISGVPDVDTEVEE